MRITQRVFATGVVMVLVLVGTSGCFGPHQQQPPTGAMARELDARVEAAVEGTKPLCPILLPPAVESYCYAVCAARVFGVSPVSARTAAGVTEAYAEVYCESVDEQHIDETDTAPAAVKFTTDPPTVQIPGDTQPYAKLQADINRIFPPDVRSAARAVSDPDPQLVARADAKAKGLPTAAPTHS